MMKKFGKKIVRPNSKMRTKWEQKKSPYLQSLVRYGVSMFFCCGGRTRTYDLWVMSPTSYHCSTPRFRDAKIGIISDSAKNFTKYIQ
jgi:hypothetical protein